MNSYVWFGIGICLAFLLGYILGKIRGFGLGLEKGKVDGVLDCRIKGLELGRCQTCGGKVGGTIYPTKAYGVNTKASGI